MLSNNPLIRIELFEIRRHPAEYAVYLDLRFGVDLWNEGTHIGKRKRIKLPLAGSASYSGLS